MIYWEITTSLSQYPKQNIPRFPVQEISYLKKMRRKYLIMKFRYRTEQERATKKKIPIPRGYHARTQNSICFQHTSYLITHFLNNIKELHKAI